jgi:hypothetical protein
VDRHGIGQCLGAVEVEARENPSGLAATNSQELHERRGSSTAKGSVVAKLFERGQACGFDIVVIRLVQHDLARVFLQFLRVQRVQCGGSDLAISRKKMKKDLAAFYKAATTQPPVADWRSICADSVGLCATRVKTCTYQLPRDIY